MNIFCKFLFNIKRNITNIVRVIMLKEGVEPGTIKYHATKDFTW